jgi:hypothetical protein
MPRPDATLNGPLRPAMIGHGGPSYDGGFWSDSGDAEDVPQFPIPDRA